MLKNDKFYHYLLSFWGFQWWQAKWGRSQKEAFEEKFLWGGWQNNVSHRRREAYFQEFGFMSYGNTAKLEGSMTFDEEMKDLFAKAAKASRKQEK